MTIKATDAQGIRVVVSGHESQHTHTLVQIEVDASYLRRFMGSSQHVVTLDVVEDDGRVARFFVRPQARPGQMAGCWITGRWKDKDSDKRVSAPWRSDYCRADVEKGS